MSQKCQKRKAGIGANCLKCTAESDVAIERY